MEDIAMKHVWNLDNWISLVHVLGTTKILVINVEDSVDDFDNPADILEAARLSSCLGGPQRGGREIQVDNL